MIQSPCWGNCYLKQNVLFFTRDRLLRPAMVLIAKAPAAPVASEE
jgi:hypothetical protein